MKKYYIISTKYTYKNSACFTFWGQNSSGYCWWQQWAGEYDISEIKKYENRENEGLFIVDSDILRKLWKTAIYCGTECVSVLPNTGQNRKIIGLKLKDLKGGMSNISNNDLNYQYNLKCIVRRDQ